MSLESINFTYSKGELNDSLTNLINNAYLKEKVFLGRNDEDFLKVLRYIANDIREGKVAFYSNYSQTVNMFYYYALLPLSGKSTPQGIAPEGEGDSKWDSYTQYIIWYPNETLLKLAGTRWIISNYPLNLDSSYIYKTIGQYRLYEFDDVKILDQCEGTIQYNFGEIKMILNKACKNFIFAESYNSRWRAYNQYGDEVKIERSSYGFMKLTSTKDIEEIRLIYSDITIDVLGRIISIFFLVIASVILISIKLNLRKKLLAKID